MSKSKDAKDEVIVSSSEVEKEVSQDVKQEFKEKKREGEPTFFHYAVVLFVIFLFFGLLYFGFEAYDRYTDDGSVDNPNLKIKLYKYPFVVDGVDYSIEFYNPVDVIEKMSYPIEISKVDLLNTKEFYFAFDDYNGDGGEVVRTSGRLFPFLARVYRFNLDTQKHVVSNGVLSCENSSIDYKIVMFDINSSRSGVFYDSSNGCIVFEVDDPKKMGALGDKFFYEIINE